MSGISSQVGEENEVSVRDVVVDLSQDPLETVSATSEVDQVTNLREEIRSSMLEHGEFHRSTLSLQLKLAKLLENENRNAEAEAQYRECLNLCKKSIPEETDRLKIDCVLMFGEFLLSSQRLHDVANLEDKCFIEALRLQEAERSIFQVLMTLWMEFSGLHDQMRKCIDLLARCYQLQKQQLKALDLIDTLVKTTATSIQQRATSASTSSLSLANSVCYLTRHFSRNWDDFEHVYGLESLWTQSRKYISSFGCGPASATSESQEELLECDLQVLRCRVRMNHFAARSDVDSQLSQCITSLSSLDSDSSRELLDTAHFIRGVFLVSCERWEEAEALLVGCLQTYGGDVGSYTVDADVDVDAVGNSSASGSHSTSSSSVETSSPVKANRVCLALLSETEVALARLFEQRFEASNQIIFLQRADRLYGLACAHRQQFAALADDPDVLLVQALQGAFLLTRHTQLQHERHQQPESTSISSANSASPYSAHILHALLLDCHSRCHKALGTDHYLTLHTGFLLWRCWQMYPSLPSSSRSAPSYSSLHASLITSLRHYVPLASSRHTQPHPLVMLSHHHLAHLLLNQLSGESDEGVRKNVSEEAAQHMKLCNDEILVLVGDKRKLKRFDVLQCLIIV